MCEEKPFGVEEAIDFFEKLRPENIFYGLAIKALRKQIPKSPLYQGDGYAPDGTLVLDTWICPNCDEAYEVDYDEYDYCPKCGQRIDWNEDDWEEDDEVCY